MTNFEIYKEDLLKIEGEFAVNKNTGEITRCDNRIDCEDCIFISKCCRENYKIQWLYKEYEPPVLSDDELELINVLGKINGKEYKYLARDVYGIARLFETKPCTNKTGNYCGEYTYIDIASGSEILFSNITHKDGLYDIENKCFIKEGDD